MVIAILLKCLPLSLWILPNLFNLRTITLSSVCSDCDALIESKFGTISNCMYIWWCRNSIYLSIGIHIHQRPCFYVPNFKILILYGLHGLVSVSQVVSRDHICTHFWISQFSPYNMGDMVSNTYKVSCICITSCMKRPYMYSFLNISILTKLYGQDGLQYLEGVLYLYHKLYQGTIFVPISEYLNSHHTIWALGNMVSNTYKVSCICITSCMKRPYLYSFLNISILTILYGQYGLQYLEGVLYLYHKLYQGTIFVPISEYLNSHHTIWAIWSPILIRCLVSVSQVVWSDHICTHFWISQFSPNYMGKMVSNT